MMKQICVLALMTLVVLISSTAHAALVERLMGEPGFAKISVHAFFAINNERIHGRQTRQNVIDALSLSGADITEYDTLAALAPSGSTALSEAQKSLFLGSIHSVLLLAELKIAGYDTPALVRAKLGL